MQVHPMQVAIEQVVADLLAELPRSETPLSATQLCQCLGIDVMKDRSQPTRGSTKKIEGRPVIFLKPDDRPERVQWALAHELGELLSVEVYERLDNSDWGEGNAVREQVANLMATELLLPTGQFRLELQACNADLHELKTVFPSASYELIASRIPQFLAVYRVAVFDQGKVTRQYSSQQTTHRTLFKAEQLCWEQTHHSGEFQEAESEQLKHRCWAIHEPDWKREILISEPKWTDGEDW